MPVQQQGRSPVWELKGERNTDNTYAETGFTGAYADFSGD